MNKSIGESQRERLKKVGTLASIASYLIAATISLYTFQTALPAWLFFLLQIVVAAVGIAAVWAILASSSRLRHLIFRGERRRLESQERQKQELRDDFRVLVFDVKCKLENNLWYALHYLIPQGQGTEKYQAMVYDALARTTLLLGGIYRNFDPSTVSSDLLTHHKSKLEKTNLLAAYVMQNAGNVKSLGENTFAGLIKNLNDALWELHTDMEKTR